jgi:regulator of sigma E protease
MPAGRAGILAGDSIASVDAAPTPTWGDVVNAISAAPGREVRIGVVRDGSSRTFALVPETAIDTNPLNGATREVGRVGIAPTIARDGVSPVQAVVLGTRQSWFMATRVVDVLAGLVTGRIGVNQLGGPVAIVRASVETARTGMENLLVLIAFLSINLMILNLVPIPLLDGGQLLLQTAESIKGKPFSDRAREWYARIGLAAIAALFLVVTFNDLRALVISWIS